MFPIPDRRLGSGLGKASENTVPKQYTDQEGDTTRCGLQPGPHVIHIPVFY